MQRYISPLVGAEIAHLLHKTLHDHPPVINRHAAAPVTGNTRRIGQYLLSLGYITPTHLMVALAEQRKRAENGANWALGDLLVQQGVLHPQVLTTVLLVQSMDRLLDQHNPTPLRLGEYLVMSKIISPVQLASALQMQTWLRLRGTQILIGDLLIQQGALDKRTLARALQEQKREPTQLLTQSRMENKQQTTA